MKITVEVDRSILGDKQPDIEVITIDRNVCDLSELLILYTDLTRAMGYHFDGHITIEEGE